MKRFDSDKSLAATGLVDALLKERCRLSHLLLGAIVRHIVEQFHFKHAGGVGADVHLFRFGPIPQALLQLRRQIQRERYPPIMPGPHHPGNQTFGQATPLPRGWPRGMLLRMKKLAVSALTTAAALAVAAPAFGQLTTVLNRGPSANRVDIVFLGDGYLAQDLQTTYTADVLALTDYLFTPRADYRVDPFPRYQNFFNVHKVDTASNQRGADDPINNVFVDTAFDATYRYDGVTDRLLYINQNKGIAAQNAALAGTGIAAEMRFVTVNSTKYGGGGGYYGVYAGGNGSAREIALHEIGHSFAGLADEYDYGRAGPYSGPEPSSPNITADPTGSKWSHWLGYNQPGIGVIGAYEGAGYHATGLYRPSDNSKMRALDRPFDVVSREEIILDLYRLVDPIDAHTDNSATLLNPDELVLDLIDGDVIDVQWLIDGVPVLPIDETTLDLATLGLTPGDYAVTATAFDPTEWVRVSRELLQQTVTWNVSITAVPEPVLAGVLLPLGMFLTRRR